MNKKLIKELEACGFVIGSLDILSKKLDNKYLCEYRAPTEELWISEDKSVLFTKMHQTFAQIAEKVLELTGVTLTPKQTKRQEIDTLREELETVKSRLNNLSSWAMSENKRRDVDLRALKYNLKKNGILVDSLTEPKSEPEKTEGVFKVGDPVVIIHNPKNGLDANYINSAILNKTQHIITSEDARSNHLGTKINDAVYWFTPNDLQHAPKEAAKVLEFGDMLESLVDFDGVKIGQNVVFLSKSAKKYKEDVPEGLKKYHVIDEWTNHYFMTADSFKGFEPKEKVLEFGGWAELMQNLGGWAKGAKVLLISKVDQSPESVFKFFLCANGDGEHQKINSEQLKAL